MSDVIKVLNNHSSHRQFHDAMLSIASPSYAPIIAQRANAIYRRLQAEIACHGNLLLTMSELSDYSHQILSSVNSPIVRPCITRVFDATISIPKNWRREFAVAMLEHVGYAHQAAAAACSGTTDFDMYQKVRPALDMMHNNMAHAGQMYVNQGLIQLETFMSVMGDVSDMTIGVSINQDHLVANCEAAGVSTVWADKQHDNPYHALAMHLLKEAHDADH